MLLDESAIDYSQWLPKSFREEYPHRAKQLSVSSQHNTYQHRKSMLPIEQLLERDIITGEQYHAGIVVASLRRSIRHSLGVERMVCTIMPVLEESSNFGMSPTVMLNFLLNGLNKWQCELVEHITTIPKHDRPVPPLDEQVYWKWFNLCVDATRDGLDRINKNVDKAEDMAKNRVTE